MIDFEAEIPAPGAPLKPEIHPVNQAILDSEVARRLELARSKLTRRQLNQLTREYNKLHLKLNRAGYNRLVVKRDELLEEYRSLYAEYRAKPDKGVKKRLLEVKQEGQDTLAKLAKLKPLLDRFLEIKQRLDTHEKVLQLEREEKQNRKKFYEEANVWEQQILAVFRQSRRLHHITQGKDGRDIIRPPVIDHIILKPDKVYFRVKTMRQGVIDRFTGLWHSALPYGVDVSALVCEETLQNLTAACGRVVKVEQTPRSQNIFYVISRLDSADGIPKLVHFSHVTDFYPADKHRATPWAAGLGEDRKIIHFDFEQHFNLLIAGSVGGGKSNLVNAILAQLSIMNSPDELRLLLIDNQLIEGSSPSRSTLTEAMLTHRFFVAYCFLIL